MISLKNPSQIAKMRDAGKILREVEDAEDELENYKSGYLMAAADEDKLGELKPYLIGYKKSAFGFTGLIRAEDAKNLGDIRTAPADLESIMIYTEQEAPDEKASI